MRELQPSSPKRSGRHHKGTWAERHRKMAIYSPRAGVDGYRRINKIFKKETMLQISDANLVDPIPASSC